MAGICLYARPPQNGTTLFQNGAVPGRSGSFLERARPRSDLERNDLEQGTTRFQRNGNQGKYLERGRAQNKVLPSRSLVGAQHKNGFFRVRMTLCQNEILTSKTKCEPFG